MELNRRSFIGSLAATAVMPTFALDTRTEFEKCRDDILYWVDNYLTVYDALRGELKMSPQQREYLKRMSETKDILVCAKGRQIGASTANLVFAHWKTRFFENQHVFIVEPNLGMASRFQEIDRESIFHTPVPCQEGSMVHITTPRGIERGIDWHDPNNTFILDEYAWWGNDCMELGCEKELHNLLMGAQIEGSPLCNVIVVSTPADHMDSFSMMMNNIDDSRRLVLPSPRNGFIA